MLCSKRKELELCILQYLGNFRLTVTRITNYLSVQRKEKSRFIIFILKYSDFLHAYLFYLDTI